MLPETPQNYTFPAGAAAPIPGFPNLPSVTIDPSKYPALDQVPPVDSDIVKQWVSKIDMSKAPNVSVNGLNGCTNTTFNAASIAKSGSDGNCWSTCSGCIRDTDVTSCPNKGTWGASFDDGPSPYTPSLLQYLDQKKLKATFFVVGSRVISYPKVLQAEYMSSHQICLHTWSHTSLTTLTNEQIIAEFAWSMKAIKDVIGVTPNCARPPYGDVDDRVRYIMKSMGLSVILWTSVNGVAFDTEGKHTALSASKPSAHVARK
ncbi:family 4 carbohydrate esterase [Melampsora larici-populina 98AG31]|uniref:chitin deacetylase n=1 Tax=Melampsora larici-populina (strain 98AG31 / pathotype 3-4-7) TaxID=747676 RepID=F4S8K7_MELLP|nr:family 4 carbohydrate esterase [Melampsora larici-populina 98AG31]EGF99006.1 family 4 carbohydrate esterase [Melampsora larici-populina 98AG31]